MDGSQRNVEYGRAVFGDITAQKIIIIGGECQKGFPLTLGIQIGICTE